MRIRASMALLLVLTGCTTTYRVPKTEISRLNGWYVPDLVVKHPGDGRLEEPRGVKLRDTEGREHAFTEDTPLVLVQNNGMVIAEKYIDVKVDAEHFRAVPLDAFRRSVEIPLSDVKSAGIRELHLGKTLLLVSGVALGVVGALVGIRLAIGNPTPNPPVDPCGEAGCPF
ncbi:hypothetical protein [Hyalangium gracile]|uniref:hypothetical protein n=1 Tax=Hyalangium gracile TaxID=394092 RepID=UPI001CC9288F|nr:hypothetical protein [Hyalangium gracile]